MNIKWCVSTFFLIACITFGALQKQVVVPNQEIVLEFVDTKINKDDVENTIADIEKKLLRIGVSNILIQENKNGTLKIAYYSTLDVKNIKEVITSKSQNLSTKNKKNNKKENTSYTYNIAVYELAKNTDFSNSNKKTVLNTKYNSNRFTTNNTYAFFSQNSIEKVNFRFTIAYKASKKNPFAKDKSSYREPEVRAGPKNTVA